MDQPASVVRSRRAQEAADDLRSSLVEHAEQLVVRDGAAALTMRALAAEAGCALGLPYKVFADRAELVSAILHAQFSRLQNAYDDLLERTGVHTVGDNLAWFAQVLLASPAIELAHEFPADRHVDQTLAASAKKSGTGPAEWEKAVSRYLSAEQRAGRVAQDVDTAAFGFLVAGAVHNLIMSGGAYPRPSARRLRQLLKATADAIAVRV